MQNTTFLSTLIHGKYRIFSANRRSIAPLDHSCGARCVQKVFISVVPSLIFPTTPWSLHAGTRQRPNGSFNKKELCLHFRSKKVPERDPAQLAGPRARQAGVLGPQAPGPWGADFRQKWIFRIFTDMVVDEGSRAI